MRHSIVLFTSDRGITPARAAVAVERAGFGWNTDELADHVVPAGKRRQVLREYLDR